MTNVNSRPKTRILLAATVGVLIVSFLFAAVRAARLASKNLVRHNEEYVYELERKWIDGEVTRLSSGQTSHVHFYATSNSDLLVNRLAGMAEVRSLTFWETDLSDNGLSIIASLPSLEKLTINRGRVSDSGLEFLSQNQILRKLHFVNLNLSNDYNYSFSTNRLGVNFRVNQQRFNYSFGLSAQPNVLEGNSVVLGVNTPYRNTGLT